MHPVMQPLVRMFLHLGCGVQVFVHERVMCTGGVQVFLHLPLRGGGCVGQTDQCAPRAAGVGERRLWVRVQRVGVSRCVDVVGMW